MQYGTYILGMVAADRAFVSAAASESDAAKFHIRSIAKNAGGTLGRPMPLDCLWRSERRLGDHPRQFDRRNTFARRTGVQNSRLEFLISQTRQPFCSSVQPEKACDKEDDDDDADDVENVHCTLRLEHARTA